MADEIEILQRLKEKWSSAFYITVTDRVARRKATRIVRFERGFVREKNGERVPQVARVVRHVYARACETSP